jgi:hypothetical protein
MSNEIQKEINTTELLMQISNDVAVVKNELTNMKANMHEDMDAINSRVKKLEDKVSVLERSDDAKYASRYKRLLIYFATGFGGICIAKIPDVILLIIKALKG